MTNRKPDFLGISKDLFVSSYKFFPPQPLIKSINRHQLLADIFSNITYSAVIIQGPAGHGKTTLMRQIYDKCQGAGAATAWLTLDESDNDISRFNSYFSNLILNAIYDSTGSQPDTNKQPKGNSAVENILNLLDSTQQPISIFIDELQSLKEDVNRSLLDSVIERSAPNVTFYIGSRSIPDIARGKLLISGRIKWVTTEELCFSSEEIQDFLNTVGLTVTKEEVLEFREQTGGWPAVLQFLQLALKGGKIEPETLLAWAKGSPRELADYLADNVMLDQPTYKKSFLLQTSLLERFSPQLCEVITGYKNTEKILQDFVSQGLFIRTIDIEQKWYKYHSLFSDYLRIQLTREDSSKTTKIYYTAAKWYREHGYFEDAIRHAVKGKAYELAADILNEWVPQLMRKAMLQTIERLCALLPENVYSTRPLLSWGRIWIHLFLSMSQSTRYAVRDFEKVAVSNDSKIVQEVSIPIMKSAEAIFRDDLENFRSHIDKISIETGDISKLRCFEMNILANLKTVNYLELGRFSEARNMALIGESLGERGEATFSWAYAISLTAYTMIQDGHLLDAIKYLKKGLGNDQLKIQGSFATSSISAVYGIAQYEAGNYFEAESHLRDTIDMISKTLPLAWLIPAYLVLIRACTLTENETLDSMELLDHAEKLGLISQHPRMVQAIRRERIRLALVNNDYEKALALKNIPEENIQTAETPPGWIHLAESCDDKLIADARFEIHCGDPNKAVSPIKTALNHANSCGWTRRKVKLLILMSMTHHVINKEPQTTQLLLSQALELASAQCYVAQFIDEGTLCLTLLSDIVKKPGTFNPRIVEFASHILEVAGSNIVSIKAPPLITLTPEQLTKRELDILKLVVNGATNIEIADRLFVSYNTVRFHMKNIYAKLNAKNRGHLIALVRKLDF